MGRSQISMDLSTRALFVLWLSIVATHGEPSVELLDDVALIQLGNAEEIGTSVTDENQGAISLRLEYENTLTAMTNKYCTEYPEKVGSYQIFCEMLTGLQDKWADAEAKGNTNEYMMTLGQMTGHFCGHPDEKDSDRCKTLALMQKAVPTELKWSTQRKRYLQLTKDVAKHYCQTHGAGDLFCRLTQGLAPHYFKAVSESNALTYKMFAENMQKHYCNNKISRHPQDDRCAIFPLLLQALPPNP